LFFNQADDDMLKKRSPYNTFAALLIAVSAAACSDKPPPAVPPLTSAAKLPAGAAPLQSTQQKIEAVLMKAVFGAHYRPASNDALASMPVPENEGGGDAEYVVTAAASTVLSSGETVLVTSGEVADEQGQADSAMADGGQLSVYFLRQRDGKWTIVKRFENIASIGSHGSFGAVSWPMLGKDKPGMAIEGAIGNRGLAAETITLYDISNNTVRDASDGAIVTASSNEGDCVEELAMECWDTKGTWRMTPAKVPGAYDDLVMDVTGTRSTAPGEHREEATGPRVSEKVRGVMRYAYDGKSFKAVEGEDLMHGL
jgi:hypothetical protein